MNAKNVSFRLVFAMASLLTTSFTIGSMFALAEHYSDAGQSGVVRAVVLVQR